MSEKQVILTPAGCQRIQDELRELQTVRRQEVAENIRRAKAYGDVSENAEYEDAKNEQAFLEGRISELKNILGTANILDEDEIPTDEVGIGSLVKVRDLEFNDEWEFTMVGSYEADPDADRISYESPIGEALFGKKVGETVEAAVPAGTVRYEVLSIRRPNGTEA